MNIKLAKNLRRQILRGHPWVYRHALKEPPRADACSLCRVSDNKGDIAWAMYDPHGPLALRIVSLEKTPPTFPAFARRLEQAGRLRKSFLSADTSAFRLVNGEGDLLPGMICDSYAGIAVLQFDGKGPREFWDRKAMADWLLANTECQSVVEKSRAGADRGMTLIAGAEVSNEVEVLEHGLRFKVELEKGQKTGFFLDQRENRLYLRGFSKGLEVLNLFSYTGGFSVSAGTGGAKKVTSVDSAPGAIKLAGENWAMNDLDPLSHKGVCGDVFEFLNDAHQEWEVVIVDPPSMAHSEKQKPKAMTAYESLFAQAAKVVAPGGHLVLSSCSSHIQFDDFFEITTQALSKVRRKGRYLRVSGQGPDHPFPHACPELRYLKFAHLVLD